MNISFYGHGLISFGAIAGGMITTSGDETFVMLAIFPQKALLLFGVLFLLGIVSAFFSDKLAPALKIKPCAARLLTALHHQEAKGLSLVLTFNNLKEISSARFLLLALLGVFAWGFIK